MTERMRVLMLAGVAAVVTALACADVSAAETIPEPEKLDISFDSLARLLKEVESPYITADSVLRLQPIVEHRVHDLQALIQTMEQVSPTNAEELKTLREAHTQLLRIDEKLDHLVPRLEALDQASTGYRVNMAAAQSVRDFPTIDVKTLEATHAKVLSLYQGVTYGEVLVTDSKGSLVERNVSDLLAIGNTSDKISPVLAHRLMDIFAHTKSGHMGWELNAGAFEHESWHGEGSDHIRSPQNLQCVDVSPAHDLNGKPDVRRLGEFFFAAQQSKDVSFIQIETGKDISVQELQVLFRSEWHGKVTSEQLDYALSKIVKNGSGLHIHAEFTDLAHHSAYESIRPVMASR